MSHRSFAAGCILVLAGLPLAAKDPDVIHIGLVDSLVKNLAPDRQKLVDSEFESLVRDFTGFKSRVFQGGDPFAAGKKLEAGDWHLAVFQGVEFAWAQAQNRKLQPLMLAVTTPSALRALLVAKKDDTLTGFGHLKGKDVELLPQKVHCRLFADKGAGGNAKVFFGKLSPVNSVETALDNVLRGNAQAAVVDTAALEIYKEIHPGRFKLLKVLAQSEPFPQSVIAYRQGFLSDRVLARFRDGMLKANQADKGREALANFKVSSFEIVPPDYPQLLADIIKAYPKPANQ